ncbi:MAG: phosphoribosyltransferase, partial [Candidatus Bathyarchaeota archaeon]
MKCKIVTFQEVYEMMKKVSDEVKTSGYKPTTIVGLARGGWVPARLMCDFLGITDLISLKVEHWLQTGKTKDEATICYPLTGDMKGKKILIVDDITDTGKSLITSLEYLERLNSEEVRVATMQYIPQSKYKPDYFAEEIKVWKWFIYPWNWLEDSSTLIVRLMGTQKEKEWAFNDIVEGLKESFEIKWGKKMLKNILDTMAERGQVEAVKDGRNLSYRLRDERVI